MFPDLIQSTPDSLRRVGYLLGGDIVHFVNKGGVGVVHKPHFTLTTSHHLMGQGYQLVPGEITMPF